MDEASSMTKALKDFEGAPCVDHKIQNAMKTAAKDNFFQTLEKRCRGIVAHFRRSQKVILLVLYLVFGNCNLPLLHVSDALLFISVGYESAPDIQSKCNSTQSWIGNTLGRYD